MFLGAFLFILVSAEGAPSPQDPNDDVEVLSGGPVSTNHDYDSFGGGDFPSLFGGGFGGPRVRVLLVPRRTEIRPGFSPGGLSDILTELFGIGSSRNVPEVQEVEDEQTECGPLCTLLNNVFNVDNIKGIQDHVNSVRDRQNEIDGEVDTDGLDVNNSTHTVEVDIRHY